MVDVKTTVKLNGPVFDAPRQFSLGLREAVDRGLLDLAQFEGANKVKEQLYPGHGRITANLRNHIGAKMRDHVAQFDAGETLAEDGQNLVYANWVEGIDKRNRASPGFPGWHMFKKAHEHLDNNPELYNQYIGEAIIEALE